MYHQIPKQKKVSVRLGEFYVLSWGYPNNNGRVCQFIKSTEKGFNFLSIFTGRCLCKKALYDKSFAHKKIPWKQRHFTVLIPEKLHVEQLKGKIKDYEH